MIAYVSHSGTVEDEDKSEDEILAKNVPDIDLIISGHTHTQLVSRFSTEILILFPVENMEEILERFL